MVGRGRERVVPGGEHGGLVDLAAQGIDLVDDVTRGLDLLVLADPASTSSKAVKARRLGVQVIGEEEARETWDLFDQMMAGEDAVA